jgi:hypothetical protein
MNRWFDANIDEDIASAMVRVNIKLTSGKEVSRDFRPDLDIVYEDLEKLLEVTPSMFAYWAMVMSEQKMAVGLIERKIKRRRAVIAKKIIDEARAMGVSLRGTDIKELIESDDELEKLEVEFLVAQRTAGKLWNIVEAIKMKSEHLRSLSGFKKQELRDSAGI